MEQTNVSRFFSGANAKTGFYSLYDSFTDAVGFLYVIKGSPGCGKSSFMKRIGAAAENAGQRVEYIHCSGDPDSLDAVYLPKIRIAYADGTAPHVIEPKYPGAAGRYLDFSRFLNAAALREKLPDMVDITNRYKALYSVAYAQLAAAAALMPKNQPGLLADEAAAAKRMDGLATRYLKPLHKAPTVSRRFLSAWSCRGRVMLTETLFAYCERLYLLDNALGLGHVALERLATQAAARGYDQILCHDPLEPEKLEALLLPEARLGFLAVEDGKVIDGLPCRRLHMDAPALRALSPAEKDSLRQRRRESRALLTAATETLGEAKALHDELEALYHPYVDFSGIDALAEEQLRLFL